MFTSSNYLAKWKHCFCFLLLLRPSDVTSIKVQEHSGNVTRHQPQQFLAHRTFISGKSTPWKCHGRETTWLSHRNETMTHDSRFEWLAASKSFGFARWRNWIFSLVVGGATSQLDFFMCVVFAASRLGMFQQSCLLICWCVACLNDPKLSTVMSFHPNYQEFEF